MDKKGILFCLGVALVSFVFLTFKTEPPKKPVRFPPPNNNYTTSFTLPFISETGAVKEEDTDQCPIPMKDRVRNRTGMQCVWSSLEMLGRWAAEPKLTNPPLTSRSECKGVSDPEGVSYELGQLGVRFEQTYRNRSRGIELIKKAMSERRGCLFGTPGHAMVLIHYDEASNMVKYVNNSDMSLKIQTTSVDQFYGIWDTWVVVIYADDDRFNVVARSLPIHGSKQYPKDFIPIPRKELWK